MPAVGERERELRCATCRELGDRVLAEGIICRLHERLSQRRSERASDLAIRVSRVLRVRRR